MPVRFSGLKPSSVNVRSYRPTGSFGNEYSALPVGRRVEHRAEDAVGGRDADAGHHAAGLILDGSGQAAAHLGAGRGGRRQQQRQPHKKERQRGRTVAQRD